MDVELLKLIASWTGWAPIAVVVIALIPVGVFFYNRELSNKDVTIQRLSIELENSRPRSPSLLVQNLGQHVKEYEQEIGRLNERLRILNNEVETETRKKSIIEHEKENVELQLKTALSEITSLREQLKSYEENLSATSSQILEIFSREFVLPTEIDKVSEYLENIYESLLFETKPSYRKFIDQTYLQERIRAIRQKTEEFRKVSIPRTSQTDKLRIEILHDLQDLLQTYKVKLMHNNTGNQSKNE